MTYGDSFQQIAALRAEIQRVVADANLLREVMVQMQKKFGDLQQADAVPVTENEPELLREETSDAAAEGLSVPEPDMGPEV